MQVRCIGFQLKEGHTKATIKNFLGSLSGLSTKPSEMLKQYRILLVHNSLVNGFHKGVIFNFINRKAYLEFIAKAGGKSRIQKRAYPNPPVEANFFIIHDSTHKGIYLSYRGSLSVLNFGTILGKHYKNYSMSVTNKKRIKLGFELIYSTDSLNDILAQQLDDISNVEFDASEVFTQHSLFDPAGKITQSVKAKFGFNAALAPKARIASIVNFIRTHNLTFGKINGSLNNFTRSVDIFENVDLFHVDDFDTLIPHMEAGVDTFQDAPIFDLLIGFVKDDDRVIK